jgi:hypothetical protein
MDLNLAVLWPILDPARDCFTLDTYRGNFSLCQSLNILFFFKTPDVNYILNMDNKAIKVGDEWPPALGKTTTWTGFGLQLGFHGGKGGRKKSCEGPVSVPWKVIVTRTS